MKKIMKQRILSGIKPTSRPHLGNYLGMMEPAVRLQEAYECFYMIADLHALTIPIEPAALARHTEELALDMLAAGFDPARSVLFIQSQVPQHAELTWIFNCCTPVGELERMIEYKEKVARFPQHANAGLLDYPVLQAVDILLYHPQAVPVGKDQAQHLELTNVIARKFNRRFEVDYFKEPKAMIQPETAKIMSLTDPEKKMSKSLGEQSYIGLTDSADVIRQKLAKAVTDAGPEEREMSPGVRNLFDLLVACGGTGAYESQRRSYDAGTLLYRDLKEAVAEAVIEFLKPIRERRREWEADRKNALKAFEEGTERARVIAKETMQEVREIVGLWGRIL